MAFRALDLEGNDYVRIDPRYYRLAEADLLVGDATKPTERLGWAPQAGFEVLVQLMVEHDLELAHREAHGPTYAPAAWSP